MSWVQYSYKAAPNFLDELVQNSSLYVLVYIVRSKSLYSYKATLHTSQYGKRTEYECCWNKTS